MAIERLRRYSDMIEPHAFVFIKHTDQPSLGRAVLQINQARRQVFYYRSLVLSSPARGWIALLLGEGGGLVDHLLLRNLTGRLKTIAFELQLGRYDFSYRLHQSGRTISAFESSLPYYVNHRLRMIETAKDVRMLDLAEPIERFVLKRYHDLQHPNAAITLVLRIPDAIQEHYAGSAAALRPVLRRDAEAAYISRLLAPGHNPESSFESLVALLDLPFLPADTVLTAGGGQPQQVSGYALTRPSTWLEELPEGWRRMPAMAAEGMLQR